MLKKSIENSTAPLGTKELIAIALGGMVGGGIFAILGLSVEHVGNATPIAILIGGLLALSAAYSYVKLALYYQDEGATYSFFKKTFAGSHFAGAAVGWLVTFGYISTLALYAFTFSSYFCTAFIMADDPWIRRMVAGLVILFFAVVNLTSVKGMGKLEDVIVYVKIVLLVLISVLLINVGDVHHAFPMINVGTSWSGILVVAAVTFVAYEGFQLVIHAYNEMDRPQRNIPKAIYSSIVIATLVYIILAVAAIASIPKTELIAGKEYALAAGSEKLLGSLGYHAVIFSALLATSSAINGTLFGASRLMGVIADDGYFPKILSTRIRGHIPSNAIWIMTILSFLLILSGGLRLILEFGSVTFIVVSFLMALANFKIRNKTHSHVIPTLIAMICLFVAAVAILLFEFMHSPQQLFFIFTIYIILIMGALIQSKWHDGIDKKHSANGDSRG